MKTLLVACVVAASAVVDSASQVIVGRSAEDRSRHEALQHYRVGQDALRSERFDIAEQEFQRAARLDPALELAPYGLGQVYMATRRYRQAIAAYQKCRDVFQANAIVVVGNEMAHQRRIEDQIEELENQKRIFQTPGRNPNAAVVQANIQHLDMQIKEMNEMKRRSTGGPQPTPPWISIALGSAHFRADEMADAEHEYREALKVDPKVGEAHNNLAVVCMLTGRLAEADQEIKAAEKSGFKVNPQLKDDVKKAAAR